MNLGSINENDFKESKAVAIAKNIIEENRCFKTSFCEMDKRPNLDGHMSFIYKNQERMIIEVQIKTLPQNYCLSKSRVSKYYYDCDTKVFNVVKENVSLNPVSLILVDTYNKKVFCILLTRQYVAELHVNGKTTKRIYFNDSDEFNNDKFITELLKYNKILNTNTSCHVKVRTIYNILKPRRKLPHIELEHIYDVENYGLVYTHNNILGYLGNFWVNTKGKKYHIYSLYMQDTAYDNSFNQYEYIRLESEKTHIFAYRQSSGTSITDADIVNILYEIAYFKKKDIVFYSSGIPVYVIAGRVIWRLRAEKIEKEW